MLVNASRHFSNFLLVSAEIPQGIEWLFEQPNFSEFLHR